MNVSASRNTTTSSRSGSLSVKTTSGLTKSVSIQQDVSTEPYIQIVGSGTLTKDSNVHTLSLSVGLRLGYQSNTITLTLNPARWGSSVNNIQQVSAGSYNTWTSNGEFSVPNQGSAITLPFDVVYRANYQFGTVSIYLELDTYLQSGSVFHDESLFTLS